MLVQVRKIQIIIILLIAVVSMSVSATIINIPDDYSTIQEGLDSSSSGDTVLVQPGFYVENINFNGHNIILGSLLLTTGDTSYIQETIIDGDLSGSVVTFENEENNAAVIMGFTLQNGLADMGGGIYCRGIIYSTISDNVIRGNVGEWSGGGIYCGGGASPTVSNNSIFENMANGSISIGGGISCDLSNPTISGNYISGNWAGEGGGGISCWYSDPEISGNTISENRVWFGFTNGGGIYCYQSSPAINNNTITGNSISGWEGHGGGIYCDHSNLSMNYNAITGNSASYGGGIFCYESNPLAGNNTICENFAIEGGGLYAYNSYLVIANTIFWADTAAIGGNEIYIGSSSPPVINYCDIQGGWPGEGNIDDNPLFCQPYEMNYWLAENSPCIGAGQNGEDIGAFGIGCEAIDIYEEFQTLPIGYSLLQNYPNPFNSITTITFSLPESKFVTLEVYDMLGRAVQTLVDEYLQAGVHYVDLDASQLSSGIYFYQLRVSGFIESKRMVLLK